MSLRVSLPLRFLGRVSEGYVLSLFLIEFACEAIWSWTFVGRILITVSISVLVIGLFIFSISSWFSLRICPFLPDCLSYWHVVISSSLMFLCISVVSIVTSF